MKYRNRNNISRGMIFFLMIVFAISPVMLSGTLSPDKVSAAGDVVISISPSTQVVTSGETFTVNIAVEPNNAIAGLQFDMTFDPSLVTVNEVQEGNLLTQNGATSYFYPGNIDNIAGTITGAFGVITTPGQTVSTSGTFATINLTAGTQGGTCPITLSNVVAGDIDANALSTSVIDGTFTINLPPILNSIGNKTVNEGVLLSFTISGTDPDGNALTYIASNLPSGATFDAQTRIFSWIPDYSQSGSYPNIYFEVSDGYLTDSENISITVNDINRAPILSAIGNKTVDEGVLLSFTISATDPDGDTLTYLASNLPSGATFDPQTQTFSWTPDYSQSGPHNNIYFEVSDGNLTDSEAIKITVNNANQPPVLDAIGNKTVDEGVLLSFTISATDPDGNTLTYMASNLPSGATFDPQTRTFSWIPEHNQAGIYLDVHFEVSDGNATTFENITITVNNIYKPDINDDGSVNVLDATQIGQHWDETGTAGWITEDINEDGTINVLDLIIMGQNWTG